MPKSNLAPSQNWDINSHISQSKDIAKQQEKELNNYKEKTDAINRINSKLNDYESLGLDVSQYRKRLDTKTKDLELGFGEKLGVIGRNIGNDYLSSFSKLNGGNLEKSYSQKMDELKQDREEKINPISTMATEVITDPLTYTPLSFASKGTRTVRAAKDFVKGGTLSSGLYTAKEYADDDFKAKDAALAGLFGGALNSGIGAAINRKTKGNLLNGDVTSHENILQQGLQDGKNITTPKGSQIKKQTVETAEPIIDETMQNEFIDDDEIARRMLNQNEEAKISQKLPNELPLHDEQAIKDLMKYSAKNNAIDEFISKLPDTANKEETFKILKKLELQEANNTAIKKPNLEANNTVIKKPNLKEQNNINLPPIKKSTDDILFQPKPKNSVLPKSLPLNNKQEMEEIIKYAIKNNAEDEFLSKLPANVNKEEAFNFLQSIKKTPTSKTKINQKLNEPTEKELIQKEGVDRRLSYAKNAMLSNGSQNFGGASVGGLEAEATSKDYNNDGVHDYKDNVIGALIGVLGVNGAKKIFPKAFKDKNINKNTIGMFVGKKPKDTNRVSSQGKHKIPLTDEVKHMSKIKANELSFKEFNNPNAKHKEQGIIDSKSLKRHIDKILQNPNIYAKGTQKNSSLVALKKNGADDIVVVNSNTGNVISGFKNTDEKYMDKIISKSMGGRPSSTVLHQGVDSTTSSLDGYNVVPNTKTDGTAFGQPSAINKSISKNISKSQDIKLNASPTISGGIVGGVVGATNDLDGDGQITYKDIALGALGGAGSTKGIILAKNTNAVSKATKKLKEIANTDFVDAFTGHKIYEKKSYMKTREAMISAKNKKMEDFAELHEQLNLLSDDVKKNLHKYMAGEKVKLSDSIKKLADNYINQIEKQGKELVNLGILEKAQYEKFKGRYLHRVYEKDLLKDFSQAFKKGKTLAGVHTRGREWTGTKAEYEKYLKEGKLGDFFGGKIEARKLKNGQYRFTQDWTPEQRKKWGEVEDIAYTLPETLMRMSEMTEHGKFLQKVSKDMNVISDEALDGYTQLKGKRFGALRDKYVPKDVADDITEFNRVMFGEEDGAIFSKEVKEAYRALSTFWKKSHTVYNPVAHVNNLMSNVTMQFMEGINPTKALKHAKDGALAHMKLGEFRKLTAKKLIGLTKEERKKLNLLANDSDLQLYIKANNSGLFGRSRLNDILSQYVGPTQKSKVPGTLRKLDEVSSNYYQGEDNIMRFSMLKSLVDSGKSFDEAIKQTNNTIPDYTKPMSRMAKFGRKSMLTPFISWTYYSTPIILRQFKEHPGRAAVILGALYGINKAMGIDPYNKKDIPQQNFSMKRIPIYRNGNEITTIKVDRWMPHNEILSPHDFVKNLYNGGAWKGGYEVLNNKNLYYGGKITHNEGMRKAYDISKYAVQQITPDIIDKAWNFTESAIIDKKTRTKNPVIQPRSTVQELLNAVGLNTLTYNKANQNRKVKNEELRK